MPSTKPTKQDKSRIASTSARWASLTPAEQAKAKPGIDALNAMADKLHKSLEARTPKG